MIWRNLGSGWALVALKEPTPNPAFAPDGYAAGEKPQR